MDCHSLFFCGVLSFSASLRSDAGFGDRETGWWDGRDGPITCTETEDYRGGLRLHLATNKCLGWCCVRFLRRRAVDEMMDGRVGGNYGGGGLDILSLL